MNPNSEEYLLYDLFTNQEKNFKPILFGLLKSLDPDFAVKASKNKVLKNSLKNNNKFGESIFNLEKEVEEVIKDKDNSGMINEDQEDENDLEIKETIVDNTITLDEDNNTNNELSNQVNIDIAEITELNNNFNSVTNDETTINEYKIGAYDDFIERGLVLNKQTVNSKEELAKMIVMLIEYIVKMNNYLPTIKWSDIEFTVENDFLKTKFH